MGWGYDAGGRMSFQPAMDQGVQSQVGVAGGNTGTYDDLIRSLLTRQPDFTSKYQNFIDPGFNPSNYQPPNSGYDQGGQGTNLSPQPYGQNGQTLPSPSMNNFNTSTGQTGQGQNLSPSRPNIMRTPRDQFRQNQFNQFSQAAPGTLTDRQQTRLNYLKRRGFGG